MQAPMLEYQTAETAANNFPKIPMILNKNSLSTAVCVTLGLTDTMFIFHSGSHNRGLMFYNAPFLRFLPAPHGQQVRQIPRGEI